MKNTTFLIFVLLLTVTTSAFAQVGIGTEDPDPSAMLHLESNKTGFLPPQMTETQRNGIANPAEGLIIYNETIDCLEFFDGTNWINLCPSSPRGVSFINS